jgi:acylphosphatase
MTGTERLEADIYGTVQGVFFRYQTRIEAERLGLAGSVRNLPDGSVRVVAEGPRETLERFLAWLRHGPELAIVERIELRWRSAEGMPAGFRIVR